LITNIDVAEEKPKMELAWDVINAKTFQFITVYNVTQLKQQK